MKFNLHKYVQARVVSLIFVWEVQAMCSEATIRNAKDEANTKEEVSERVIGGKR